MTISETKIYPRTGDKQTVYLKSELPKKLTLNKLALIGEAEKSP